MTEQALQKQPPIPKSELIKMAEKGLEVAEVFGIDRKEVGRALLKAATSNKFDIGTLMGGAKPEKKSGFEHVIDGLVKGIPFYIAMLGIAIAYRYVTHVWMP